MRVSASAWCLALLILAAEAAADPAPGDAEGPDLELLEYLGGLVDENDRWVGPDDMQGALDARDRAILPDDGAATAEVMN